MCGIFAILNNQSGKICDEMIKTSFNKGVNRGREGSHTLNVSSGFFGFHRLAINGLDQNSSQPMELNGIVLICNGEIFNYKQLFAENSFEPYTNSDCEIIIHMYLKYGIDKTLNKIDGEFAFVLLDRRDKDKEIMYVARDPFGIRPLFHVYNKLNHIGSTHGFSSEIKSVIDIYDKLTTDGTDEEYIVEQFQPGGVTKMVLNDNTKTWEIVNSTKYWMLPLPRSTTEETISSIRHNIAEKLMDSVIKRIVTTDRPVACLLSGGLDSSLVTALVNNYYKSIHNVKINTYSIGLEGAPDLVYAKKVADYLDTEHTSVIITEDDVFNNIGCVIQAIESYDTTTVRASIGNYLVAKYISENSDQKVILNGDGSDELFGGYIYMNKCPQGDEYDGEVRRLLNNISYFDVLRSDKSISSHNLETRTPFLDKDFVDYYLSLPIDIRFRLPKNIRNSFPDDIQKHERTEKELLRVSFTSDIFKNYKGGALLPDDILWRRKEAFSDGVSKTTKSLFTILQERIVEYYKSKDIIIDSGIEAEKRYYKELFDTYYPNCENVIPYYWMPKYTDTNDPSARTI